jgi:hypothetical protein
VARKPGDCSERITALDNILNKDRITTGSFNEEDTLNGMAFDTLDTFLELTQLFLKPRTLARIKQAPLGSEKSGRWLNLL